MGVALLVATTIFTTVAPARVSGAVPVSIPTVTAPTEGATVGGIVTLTATTAAPSVRFSVDGSALPTVAAVGGVATVAWPTWGTPNGTVAVTAVDCDAVECSSAGSAPRTLTVANAAPVLTAPVSGALTGTRPTMRASASGGGIAFLVDGVQVGFDSAAPYAYTLTTPLALGAHTGQVVRCDSAGSRCEGAVSAAVSFTALSLAPRITSVAPDPFSPNADGRRDTTRFVVSLPDAQSVSFAIRGSDGTRWLLRSLGRLSAGLHPISWNGRDQAGRRVADGRYTIEVETSDVRNGETFTGKTSAPVRVDTVAPGLSSLSGAGSTFYPYPDGYRDAFGPQVTVGSAGTLRLFVSTATGVRVRTIVRTVPAAGRYGLSWDGRLASGRRVAGSYRFAFEAEDVAGNRRRTQAYGVIVSMKRLATRTAVRTVAGAGAVDVFASDPSCAFWSTSASDFVSGLWLDNFCDGDEAIIATYGFEVPAAVSYGTVRVESYGNTINPPTFVGTLIYDFANSEWDIFGGAQVNGYGVDQWSNFGTKSAKGRVSGTRRLRIALGVGTDYIAQDYDIALVKITIAYNVLV